MSTTTLAAVVAKLAALGLPAKAAGVAVAVGVIGGVPAVAHAVDSSHQTPAVVETTTSPTGEPTVEPSTAPTDEPTAIPTDDATAAPTPTEEPSAPAPEPTRPASDKDLPETASFGQSVAEDARDGGVDGQEIAEQARQKSASDTALEHRPDVTPPTDKAPADPGAHAED